MPGISREVGRKWWMVNKGRWRVDGSWNWGQYLWRPMGQEICEMSISLVYHLLEEERRIAEPSGAEVQRPLSSLSIGDHE